MDVAASEFMTEDGKYDLNFKNKPNDGSQIKTGCALWPPALPQVLGVRVGLRVWVEWLGQCLGLALCSELG